MSKIRRRFIVKPNGDPYSRAWEAQDFGDCSDYEAPTCTYRGDLSGMSKTRLVRTLRRLYPGCCIRVE